MNSYRVKLRIKTDCQQFVLKDEEQDKLDEVTISEGTCIY